MVPEGEVAEGIDGGSQPGGGTDDGAADIVPRAGVLGAAGKEEDPATVPGLADTDVPPPSGS